MQTSDPATILERIRDLEAELADYRRRLGTGPEPLPSANLLALEVIVKGQRYLLPSSVVREVVQMALPQPLADTPDWVMGTIPYGTETVPLVDLGLRLGQGMTDISPELFVIITDSPSWLGLVTEDVGQVVSIEPASLATPNPEIPCAPFLLASNHGDDGEAVYVISIERLGREINA
jgi:chemotaxis signal transduction protein